MRWQDYLWLLLLCGSFLLFSLLGRKRRAPRKPLQRADRPLTRREQKAWHKLQDSGYRLAEIHPGQPVTMTVDGKKREFSCQGNFIVSRGGEIFLVKVIRGEEPPSWPALQRELLLDALFFQTDGIFFYLEKRGVLQEIRFSFRGEPGLKGGLLWKAALVLVLAVAAAFLVHLLGGGIP